MNTSSKFSTAYGLFNRLERQYMTVSWVTLQSVLASCFLFEKCNSLQTYTIAYELDEIYKLSTTIFILITIQNVFSLLERKDMLGSFTVILMARKSNDYYQLENSGIIASIIHEQIFIELRKLLCNILNKISMEQKPKCSTLISPAL